MPSKQVADRIELDIVRDGNERVELECSQPPAVFVELSFSQFHAIECSNKCARKLPAPRPQNQSCGKITAVSGIERPKRKRFRSPGNHSAVGGGHLECIARELVIASLRQRDRFGSRPDLEIFRKIYVGRLRSEAELVAGLKVDAERRQEVRALDPAPAHVGEQLYAAVEEILPNQFAILRPWIETHARSPLLVVGLFNKSQRRSKFLSKNLYAICSAQRSLG